MVHLLSWSNLASLAHTFALSLSLVGSISLSNPRQTHTHTYTCTYYTGMPRTVAQLLAHELIPLLLQAQAVGGKHREMLLKIYTFIDQNAELQVVVNTTFLFLYTVDLVHALALYIYILFSIYLSSVCSTFLHMYLLILLFLTIPRLMF